MVLDLVCGAPMIANLKATRRRVRGLAIGIGAGREVTLDIADLPFRTLSCVRTGQCLSTAREDSWRRFLRIGHEHGLVACVNLVLTLVYDRIWVVGMGFICTELDRLFIFHLNSCPYR